MDVTEQLPDILVSAFKTKEGIVVQIDSPLANLYVHLHGDMLEPSHKALTYILQVMVAYDKIYFTVKPVKNLCPFGSTAKTEVAKMKDYIILANRFIPVGYHLFVHFIDIPERTLTIPQYICMVEVGVRGEVHPTSVKFEIHILFRSDAY